MKINKTKNRHMTLIYNFVMCPFLPKIRPKYHEMKNSTKVPYTNCIDWWPKMDLILYV